MRIYLVSMLALLLVPHLALANKGKGSYGVGDRSVQQKGGDYKTGKAPKYKLLVMDIYPNNEKDSYSKSKVNGILNKAIDEAISDNKSKVDGITIKLFQSKEHTKRSSSTPIGEAEWWPKGHSFSLSNKANIEDKSKHVKKVSVFTLPKKVKYKTKGLSQTKRKEIFTSLAKSQDRADDEANSRYGEYSKRAFDEGSKLKKKYRKQLLNKYKITEKQLMKIVSEGMSNNWPLPSR